MFVSERVVVVFGASSIMEEVIKFRQFQIRLINIYSLLKLNVLLDIFFQNEDLDVYSISENQKYLT